MTWLLLSINHNNKSLNTIIFIKNFACKWKIMLIVDLEKIKQNSNLVMKNIANFVVFVVKVVG